MLSQVLQTLFEIAVTLNDAQSQFNPFEFNEMKYTVLHIYVKQNRWLGWKESNLRNTGVKVPRLYHLATAQYKNDRIGTKYIKSCVTINST